jgi:hypothetical protein
MRPPNTSTSDISHSSGHLSIRQPQGMAVQTKRIGLAAGVVFLLLGIVILTGVLYLLKRRKRQRELRAARKGAGLKALELTRSPTAYSEYSRRVPNPSLAKKSAPFRVRTKIQDEESSPILVSEVARFSGQSPGPIPMRPMRPLSPPLAPPPARLKRPPTPIPFQNIFPFPDRRTPSISSPVSRFPTPSLAASTPTRLQSLRISASLPALAPSSKTLAPPAPVPLPALTYLPPTSSFDNRHGHFRVQSFNPPRSQCIDSRHGHLRAQSFDPPRRTPRSIGSQELLKLFPEPPNPPPKDTLPGIPVPPTPGSGSWLATPAKASAPKPPVVAVTPTQSVVSDSSSIEDSLIARFGMPLPSPRSSNWRGSRALSLNSPTIAGVRNSTLTIITENGTTVSVPKKQVPAVAVSRQKSQKSQCSAWSEETEDSYFRHSTSTLASHYFRENAI